VSQPVNAPIPISLAIILPKLLPLILDGSASVRSQLLKFLRLVPSKEVAERVESALLYVRAGMTHLAAEIRNDAVLTLEWLLENGGEAVVSCPGGWVKTLKAFMSMMGWAVSSGTTKWTSAAKTSFGKVGKAFPKQLMILAQFLIVGIGRNVTETTFQRASHYPLWDVELHMIPSQSSPYAHLNLFGPGRDEEGEMYTERDSRQRVFRHRFQASVEKGVENAKREGGDVGRAAAVLEKTMAESMNDFAGVEEVPEQRYLTGWMPSDWVDRLDSIRS
jgi:pre-rRNA-processing protein IPI1